MKEISWKSLMLRSAVLGAWVPVCGGSHIGYNANPRVTVCNPCIHGSAHLLWHTFVHFCLRQNWTYERARRLGLAAWRRRYIVLGWVDGACSSVVSWLFRHSLGSFGAPSSPPSNQGISSSPPSTPFFRGSVSRGSPLSTDWSMCQGWFGRGPTSPPGSWSARPWRWTVAAAARAGRCPSPGSRALRVRETRSTSSPLPPGTQVASVPACRWRPLGSGSSRRPSRAAAWSTSSPRSTRPRQDLARTRLSSSGCADLRRRCKTCCTASRWKVARCCAAACAASGARAGWTFAGTCRSCTACRSCATAGASLDLTLKKISFHSLHKRAVSRLQKMKIKLGAKKAD